MNRLLTIFSLMLLIGCASTNNTGVVWQKDGATEEQIAKDLEHCSEVASAVFKKSSRGLHRGGISTARSSIAQVDPNNQAFEDTPANQKIVRGHCMEKKKFVKASK